MIFGTPKRITLTVFFMLSSIGLLFSTFFVTYAFAQDISNSSDSEKLNITSQKTVINGFNMHYIIGGTGKGDPIILLHGWPQTSYEWRHIIPQLIANNYTIIAPDLRGLGDSGKPLTGYDTKTLADDVYQLVSKLGYKKIYLVGHDFGALVAYAYSAEHRESVNKMIILDITLPGFGLEEAGDYTPYGLWHLSFQSVRDLPEKLIEGKEDVYLNWFYDWGTYNTNAITPEDREEYIKQYSKPGALRAGFEYYRAIFEDAEQNKEYAKQKLNVPILTIGGEASGGNFTAISFQQVANNITGITVPKAGHFIPEDSPSFLADKIIEFFK